MPLYEFRCEDCSVDFEELVPSGTQAIPCPKCGGGRVHRLISLVAFSVGGKMTTAAPASACGGCSSTNCSGCGSKR